MEQEPRPELGPIALAKNAMEMLGMVEFDVQDLSVSLLELRRVMERLALLAAATRAS